MAQRSDRANSKIQGTIQWFSRNREKFRTEAEISQQTILDQIDQEGTQEYLPG